MENNGAARASEADLRCSSPDLGAAPKSHQEGLCDAAVCQAQGGECDAARRVLEEALRQGARPHATSKAPARRAQPEQFPCRPGCFRQGIERLQGRMHGQESRLADAVGDSGGGVLGHQGRHREGHADGRGASSGARIGHLQAQPDVGRLIGGHRKRVRGRNVGLAAGGQCKTWFSLVSFGLRCLQR